MILFESRLEVIVVMMILEWLKAVLYGIVEGITEWLPVSSTGHMLLFERLWQLNATDTFKEMFFVVIQLGAILAVVVMFFKKLFPFSLQKTENDGKTKHKLDRKSVV